MNLDQAPGLTGAGDIPAPWQAAVGALLAPQENVFAVLEVDLDAQLRFVPSLLLATDRRLVWLPAAPAPAQSWDYRPGLRLEHHDHAGLAHLQ